MIPTYNDIKESQLFESEILDILDKYRNSDWTGTEEEIIKNISENLRISSEEYGGLQNINEGILGNILGGTAGFFLGPSIGKVIARALGVEKGILYDLFTSKLVGIALGAAIAKQLEENKIKK
jgi:hypothetical protein